MSQSIKEALYQDVFGVDYWYNGDLQVTGNPATYDKGSLLFSDQPHAGQWFRVNTTTFTEGVEWHIGGTLLLTLASMAAAVVASSEAYTAQGGTTSLDITAENIGPLSEVFDPGNLSHCTAVPATGAFSGGAFASTDSDLVPCLGYDTIEQWIGRTLEADIGSDLIDTDWGRNSENPTNEPAFPVRTATFAAAAKDALKKDDRIGKVTIDYVNFGYDRGTLYEITIYTPAGPIGVVNR